MKSKQLKFVIQVQFFIIAGLILFFGAMIKDHSDKLDRLHKIQTFAWFTNHGRDGESMKEWEKLRKEGKVDKLTSWGK